jgi:hypothetical protein
LIDRFAPVSEIEAIEPLRDRSTALCDELIRQLGVAEAIECGWLS